MAPPTPPCLRAEASGRQEPAERPRLPGASWLRAAPLAIPFRLSPPFPQRSRGHPGERKRERERERGGEEETPTLRRHEPGSPRGCGQPGPGHHGGEE